MFSLVQLDWIPENISIEESIYKNNFCLYNIHENYHYDLIEVMKIENLLKQKEIWLFCRHLQVVMQIPKNPMLPKLTIASFRL